MLRIFDLTRPDAPPTEIGGSPGAIRAAVWHHSDQTILSSFNDAGGIRCVPQFFLQFRCYSYNGIKRS